MSGMKKRIIALFLIICIMIPLGVFPVSGREEDGTVHRPASWEEVTAEGTLWENVAPEGDTLDVSLLPKTGGILTIPDTVQALSITGDGQAMEASSIQLTAGCNVTLADLYLRAAEGTAAFSSTGTSNLEIDGIVRLEGSNTCPAVYVPADTTLTIEGRGTLDALAGDQAAAIGSGATTDCGNLIIENTTITATSQNGGAGIGAGYGKSFQSLTIRGGTVTATGGAGGAGIGGGDLSTGGIITITSGKVTAQGGIGGAGIGGGRANKDLKIYISGGEIETTGGEHGAGIGGGWLQSGETISISGGTIYATSGQYGAGIGGGDTGRGGMITVSGGNINASGYEGGAGIGGGNKGGGGTISLKGGEIFATGGQYGAGIGGGSNGVGGMIQITSGTITATGANGAAGIGGGYGATGGQLHVYGGTITANAGVLGAGIGGGCNGMGDNVTISGGVVTANGNHSGAGIGGGYGGGGGSVNIDGGTVTATGGVGGAGIGGGLEGFAANVSISGGVVKTVGGDQAEGIGPGANSKLTGLLYISGGSLEGTIHSKTTPVVSADNDSRVYPIEVSCTDNSEAKNPLGDVGIYIGAYRAKTNMEGKAYIYLPLGEYTVQIYGAGLESEDASIAVQKSDNPVIAVELYSTGAPIIRSDSTFSCSDAEGGSFQIEATGGRGQRFLVKEKLPEGVTLSETTGVLSVLPGVPVGNYNFNIVVSNTLEPDAEQNFWLIVTDKTPLKSAIPPVTRSAIQTTVFG